MSDTPTDDLVKQLRDMATGRTEYWIMNPEKTALCMSFDYTDYINPKAAADEWLKDMNAKGYQIGYTVEERHVHTSLEGAALRAANQMEKLERELTAARAKVAALEKYAARWKEVLLNVRGERLKPLHYKSAELFCFQFGDYRTEVNIMRGSVAEHFAEEIDKRISQRAAQQPTGEQTA